MNSLREQAIDNAISSWNDKKNGFYQWWEKERYSVEYCEYQIIFFRNLK
jgi:hypothetical protein